MENRELLRLFAERQESAIAQTNAKYGEALRRIARELLGSTQDAEEVVSDVLLTAWNTVPDVQPVSLFGYLAAVTRNLSLKQLEARSAQRRGGGRAPAVLDELDECIAAPDSVEQEINSKLLWEAVSRFLQEQPEQTRRAFLLRYSLAMPVKDVAEKLHMNPAAVHTALHRTRRKLKAYLKKEGWI